MPTEVQRLEKAEAKFHKLYAKAREGDMPETLTFKRGKVVTKLPGDEEDTTIKGETSVVSLDHDYGTVAPKLGKIHIVLSSAYPGKAVVLMDFAGGAVTKMSDAVQLIINGWPATAAVHRKLLKDHLS